jgi:AcrR family transcriptional regulator
VIDKKPQRGVEARTKNKIKRRQNILNKARNMIASDGYGSFTLAKLAKKSDVSLPTIHNLIGNKSEVLRELVQDLVNRSEFSNQKDWSSDPINAIESYMDSLISVYAADEAFYKTAFVINEREEVFEHQLSEGIFSQFDQSLAFIQQFILDAREQGHLNGAIDASFLADRLFANQRLARHDWVNDYIDLKRYKVQVVTGMFITLAADASEVFHKKLTAKISELLDVKH